MKVWNYVVLSTTLALLFEMAGMPVATSLLDYLGINANGLNIQSAGLYLAIFGGAGILIGLVGGLVIGYLTKSSPENFIILPFVIGGATLFFTTFYGIVNYVTTNYPGTVWAYLTTFISAILSVGFVISLIEFFRGTD